MPKPVPLPPKEKQRLQALQRFDILDTEPELAFDDLAKLASQICNTPIALVSLVDETRQWFKARVGVKILETPRDVAFCAHTILTPDSVMQVRDARNDERFKDFPLVTKDPGIGFYAGAPLIAEGGHPLGALCVLDTESRVLTQDQEEALEALSRQVVAQLELRRTNQELRRRNEDLAQFAYRVSHDFKAPLSSSKQLAGLLVSDLADNNILEVEANALRIQQQMEKLESFVEEMLNLARADLGEHEYEEIHVESMLQNVIDQHSALVRANGVRVAIDVESDVTVFTSRIRLFQVLDNLISNAIKYKNPEERDPFVSMSCRSSAGVVEIEIADNGVGIPAENHCQMGELFKRFHPHLANGSGLGLAIAYRHLSALDATMDFCSSEKGSSFKILLS